MGDLVAVAIRVGCVAVGTVIGVLLTGAALG